MPYVKFSGLDGLNCESLKYAHPLLCPLLSVGFYPFKHCYIPQCMINFVIVPFIKNKCCDQTDKNNYRPNTLSSITPKLFEHINAELHELYLWTNDNLFFFSCHSIDLWIYAFTEFIEHVNGRSTSVCVAFLDASKVFDKISH